LIERVERLPKPKPDVENVLAVMRCHRPERIPLLELKFDDEMMSALLDAPLIKWSRDASPEQRRKAVEHLVDPMHRMGFDVFRLRTNIPFTIHRERLADTADLSRGQREWQDEHGGPIRSFADFEHYPWPTLSDVDFGPVEEVGRALPEGMACLGFCGGVFEWSTWLMGTENFMMALYEAPDLVEAITSRVGTLIYECFERWCSVDYVPILWLADDLGFKTATLIAPEHIRRYCLPWYRRYADLAHRSGRLFMLHSCGYVESIMPDLAEAGVDAKHSFEDVIEPVEKFVCRWAGQVAGIGGVDVDLLARGSEESVTRRTDHILRTCAPLGGYAAGSGNSVTNYIPVNHYLAMLETVHRFNGRM